MEPLLGTLVIGLLVGILARAVQPGKDRLGWVHMALLGIAGAFLSTYIGLSLDWYDQGDTVGWITAAMGAMALLAAFSFAKRRL